MNRSVELLTRTVREGWNGFELIAHTFSPGTNIILLCNGASTSYFRAVEATAVRDTEPRQLGAKFNGKLCWSPRLAHVIIVSDFKRHRCA